MDKMAVRLSAAGLGIVEVEDGVVILHLDLLEAAVLGLKLADLAQFVAGPANAFEQIAKASKEVVVKAMMEKGIKSLPIGDGRSVEVKRSVSYNPLPEAIAELETRLIGEGFKQGENFEPLSWVETIPAKEVQKYADVRKLRKALTLSGVSDIEKQDEWLGKFLGQPYLKVEDA